MEIRIQSVKFDADHKLIEFIENKVSKLDRFTDDITAVEVTLKLDKNNEAGNKIATIKVMITGNDAIADRKAKSFEEAVDQCIDALKKQLEKHKDKLK
ncbi:MAG: ribosome-associated translation inhibitor RaiA [Rikenellaceae bacterium]